MGATTIPAKLVKNQVDGATKVDWDGDTLQCLLVVAGAGAPSVTKTGVQFVSDVTATNAEVTGTGYARQTLVQTVAFSSGNDNTEFGFSDITFAQNAAGFTNARYAVICGPGGADTSKQVLAIIDLDSNRSVQTNDLIIKAPTGGLIVWSRS